MMIRPLRLFLHSALCLVILRSSVPSPPVLAAPAPAVQDAAAIEPLLKKSYLELLQEAPTLRFTRQQFEQVRQRLKDQQKQKENELKSKQKRLESQIKQAQEQLKKLGSSRELTEDEIAAERHDLHCRIQAWQSELADTKIALTTGVPVEYDNLNAKLELLEKWPAAKQEIDRQIDSGVFRSRKWGDAEDIGFRTIEANQEDDVRKGQEAVDQMKQMGLLPKPIEDAEINEYVNRVAQNIARNSDLHVPLQVTLLNSREINAFALPGGFLFLNHGLLLEARSEAQFAGVIAHEISHHVARHSHRLMKKATIASLIYQAAQIGALIFTGGVVGIGTYYALTYGFQGLGLFLSLQLLGVSRDYEMEADLLGVQYLWKAGYNTEGFIEFFDIMASKEGYAEKTSWFRTHPAFYDRIVNVYREISFLPRKDEVIDNTREFDAIKAKMKKLNEELEKEEEGRPTLFKREPGCPGEPDRKVAARPAGAAQEASWATAG
ncbi:MAG TPA: M48 family metalloprotease [Terriglobia bacterium]|nr:M48 family metalloprotease [Terriglobia bacterium]